MADKALIFDGDEPVDQINLEDNMNDMEINADGDDDDYMNDAEAPDDPAEDDFKLDGFDDVGYPEDEDEDDAKGKDSEYDGTIVGEKRKRARHTIFQTTTQVDSAEAFILDEDNDFLYKQTSRVPGTFGRRNRKKGESLPAYHKRVSHELDSDDELMMQMREKGFSDRQIADKLARDGRIRYDQKSISTRIMRIRLAQAENVDFLLREGYKEWEFEDDKLLMQAHALADIEISYEIERIRAWRFRKVSEYMRRLNKDALFSAKACRERYNALMEGNARIPTEMDDDPDARRMEMEVFRESRELARNKDKEEKDAQDALERKSKDEAKLRNAQKAEETANKRAAKETEKAQRAMARATKAQLRAQQSLQNQAAKSQRNKQIQRQKVEHEAKKAKKKPAINTDVTAETPDPRGYLSIQDLGKMCADRGIQVFGKDKDQLVQDLKDDDDEYSQDDLKKMCRTKGLNASGSKVQMKYQLALAAAQAYPSFNASVPADDEMAVDAN